MEPAKVNLEGVLDEFRTALEDEIFEIKKSGRSSILLKSGRCIKHGGSEFRYIFYVDYMPGVPADTPCKLVLGNERFDVTVISCDGDNIIIASPKELPDMLGIAQLENGSTVLMERLIKCIEDNNDKQNELGRNLIRDGGRDVYSAKDIYSYNTESVFSSGAEDEFILNDQQKKAAITALTKDISFIWGPPGTGKTSVIGKIVEELYKHERSVLIVSHTNVAVDGAVENALISTKTTDDICPVLRLGTSVKQLDPKVTLESHVIVLGKELQERKEQFLHEKGVTEERLSKNIELLDKDQWIKDNQLDQFSNTIATLEDKVKAVADYKKEHSKIDDELQEFQDEHPEYADYVRCEEEIRKIEDEIKALSKDVLLAEANKNKCEATMQNAYAELRKHDVYADLKAQEAKFMPLDFLKKEIDGITKDIQQINDYIVKWNAIRSEAEQFLAEYERKNSVAKLFYNKNNVLEKQRSIQEANNGVSLNIDALKVKQSLFKDYQTQIQQIQILQEKEKAVVPSRTKKYWEDALKKATIDCEVCVQSLNRAKTLIEQKEESLKPLREKRNAVSEIYEKVSAIKKNLEEVFKSLVAAENERDLYKRNCADILSRERALQWGAIGDEEVKAFSDYSIDELAEIKQKLFDIKRQVEKELADVDIDKCRDEKAQDEEAIRKINNELYVIEEQIQQLEAEAIKQARIIGATLSKSFIDDRLRDRTFDTVIIDEASMASIPAVWCASLLAENSIVIVGDFLQLPPICISKNENTIKWLGTDVFSHSGMRQRKKNGNEPENFVTLNDQFRMESGIADLANIYYNEYPNAGLKSHDSADFRIKEREEFYNWYSGVRTKSCIHLIDTENLHAWVTGIPQGKNRSSRLNSFSASISVDLAFKVIENLLQDLDPTDAQPFEKPQVLIISPYKPQVDRVRKLIDLEYKNRGFENNLNMINTGTVHGFQGNEADVVIFDLVVDEPHWRCNLFMPDNEDSDNRKSMFNVAITRAKFKLFIIGNFSYCQKHATKDNALSKLLEELIDKRHIKKIDAKDLFPTITFDRSRYTVLRENDNAKHIICKDEDFYDIFLGDVRSMKDSMIIFSPFMTENRVSMLLPIFVDKRNENKKIIIVTKDLSERGKREESSYKKIEKQLKQYGIEIIHKKGMHEKIVIVDDDICWHGSLNVLSFTGNTGEYMERYCDELYTHDFKESLGIDLLYDAEINHELKCPVCNSDMIIREGAEGGFYWVCSSCDFTRGRDQQYPTDGEIKCKVCGNHYKFFMKNEPRWICTVDSKHYQKMHLADLKLPKMADLLSDGDRQRVMKYFEQKRNKE